MPRLVCHFSQFSASVSLLLSPIAGFIAGLIHGTWQSVLLGIASGSFIDILFGFFVYALSHVVLPRKNPTWTTKYCIENIVIASVVLVAPGIAVSTTTLIVGTATIGLGWW